MSLSLQRPDLFRQACLLAEGWRAVGSGPAIDVFNPATGERLGQVPALQAGETEAAIAAAQRALPAWAALTGKQRAGILRRWFDLMLAHQDDLARLMTLEQGKPLAEARGEIAYAASFIEWFAEEGKRVDGELLQSPTAGQQLLTLREPIGVCAAITPWNFPAAMITRKAGPALAAGCTMLVKPAESTPFTALALAVLAEEAGIPAGVFQVLTGHPQDIGQALTQSPVVRKLSFTGSTATGRLLMRQCSDTVKKLSLELGGNAPLIVFDDADIDQAVAGILASKFRNAGQTCVCANRLYVQASVYDAFADKLVAATRKLQVGDGFGAGVSTGPLISRKAMDKVERHIADARAKGATVLLGGQARDGLFFEPTVLSGATADMALAHEETFGPVAPLFKFDTVEEAITLANATEFGLASYFYARDLSRVFKVAEALQSGMVGINTGLISTELAPFGGVKQSGFGREGSKYGIEDYLEVKYLCLGV
jgi:succinate-semialdehyde dehydrogenase/glutarate-semialdehyde dehydrogenase